MERRGITTEEILLEDIVDRLDKLLDVLSPKQAPSGRKAAAPDEPPAAADPRSGSGRRPAKKTASKTAAKKTAGK